MKVVYFYMFDYMKRILKFSYIFSSHHYQNFYFFAMQQFHKYLKISIDLHLIYIK